MGLSARRFGPWATPEELSLYHVGGKRGTRQAGSAVGRGTPVRPKGGPTAVPRRPPRSARLVRALPLRFQVVLAGRTQTNTKKNKTTQARVATGKDAAAARRGRWLGWFVSSAPNSHGRAPKAAGVPPAVTSAAADAGARAAEPWQGGPPTGASAATHRGQRTSFRVSPRSSPDGASARVDLDWGGPFQGRPPVSAGRRPLWAAAAPPYRLSPVSGTRRDGRPLATMTARDRPSHGADAHTSIWVTLLAGSGRLAFPAQIGGGGRPYRLWDILLCW